MSRRQIFFNLFSPIQKTVFITGLACALLIFLTAVKQVSAASPEPQQVSSHLITVYDGDFEKTFVTDADTVREALKNEGVELEQHDRVEPSADSELVAGSYSVNVYRARPVMVVDGSDQTNILTSAQSPRQVVEQAGNKLYPEDQTQYEQATDPLADGGAGLKLVIDRAMPFEFHLYGTKFTARTQATTVREMLKEKDIELGEKDGLSVDPSAKMVRGMTVKVWRDGKQTITEEKVIKKSVEEVKDADREVGYRSVRTEGRDGKRKVTYEIELRNGREISRKQIASVVITEAVKEIVVVGTKQPGPVPYTGGGDKDDWLAASGIPRSQWGYVDSIVSRESGWNPNAVNQSSGACGLAQALPCSKVPGNPLDPVDSLRWMNGYVEGRYGGWEGAYNFWQANHWY